MITANNLISLSRQFSFPVGQYHIVSQDPTVLSEKHRAHVVPLYLPQFVNLWKAVEDATGYRWKNTSYLRNSESHKKGHAFDLAPDISPDAAPYYAVTNGSDPVLYKRQKLVTDLQKLKNIRFGPDNDMGIFIEPDHLHVQVLAFGSSPNPTTINKWGVPKPVYQDTYERMKLPVTNSSYASSYFSPKRRTK